jgi:hypothetical protein
LHIGAAEGLQALKPLPIPREFRAAAIAQLIEIGYYRKDPVIKLHVDNKGISLTSRSEIIPINGKATVVVPSTQAPKGLECVAEKFHLNDREIKIQRGKKPQVEVVKGPTRDLYVVDFVRTSNTVQVLDVHRWKSPVTPFKVAFRHDDDQTCGVGSVLMQQMTSLELKKTKYDGYKPAYEYPMASFSGQGFTWFVSWRNAFSTSSEPPYDGSLKKRLREALLKLFPKRGELMMLMEDALSQSLDTIANAGNYREDAYAVTVWLGVDPALRLKPFLAEAISQRPNAEELKALHSELFG